MRPAAAAATLAASTSLDRHTSHGNPRALPILGTLGHQGSSGWKEATKAQPCPICQRTSWCSQTTDGQAVTCRKSDGTAPPGWRVAKAAKHGGHILLRIDPLASQHDLHTLERVRVPKAKAGTKLTTEQCQEILSSARGPGWHAKVLDLAEQLHVHVQVLEHLGVGWRWGDVERGRDLHDGDHVYPMRDGSGLVVGVHRRLARPYTRDGREVGKLSVQGSATGLFYAPEHWHHGTGPILLPEGMTDTAALMHMGQAAAGRPSNRGGIDQLADLLRGVPADRPIMVLGENDRKADGRWPGREGAEQTAQELADALERPIMWALVPEPAKDAREWMTTALAAGEDPEHAGARLAAELLKVANTISPRPQDPVLDGRASTAPPVPMEQLRADLRARMMQLAQPPLVRRMLPDAEHPDGEAQLVPGVYLSRAPTGVGKSHAGLQLAVELERLGLRITYLSQTHRQSAERLAEAEQMGLGDGAADAEVSEHTCGLWHVARRARACGLSVQQVVCPSCPLRDQCLYQQRKAAAKAAPVRFACHAQGAMDLGQVTAGRDALIIDEDAVGALVRHVKMRPRDLLHALRAMRTAAKAHPKLVDDDTQLLIDLCTQATEALIRGLRQSTQPGTVLIDTRHLVADPEAGEVNWAQKLWRLLGHKGTKLPPSGAVSVLLDLITGRITEVWATHDLQATGAWHRELVAIQRHKLPRKLVVMLDATADTATLERVIRSSGTRWATGLMQVVQEISPEGRPPDVHEARRLVPVGGDVLVGSTPERATEALRGLLARIPGDRLGLICHGQHISPMCGPGIDGGGLLDDAEMARLARVAGHHTADVRGSNSWIGTEGRERLDALLVMGTPNVPWHEVRLRLLLTGHLEAAAMPDGGWIRHRVLSTAPDGTTLSNPASAHTDGTWQEARRQLVHAALLQDVGRARHTLAEGCPVYCLTCEPMPGLLTDPTPVHGIDAQTHYLMLEVAALSVGLEQPAEGAECGPEGSKNPRVKSHKDIYAFIQNDPCESRPETRPPSRPVSTARLLGHLEQLGWSQSTAKRALHQAAITGRLAQPSRGMWSLPGHQEPKAPPRSAQAPQEPTQSHTQPEASGQATDPTAPVSVDLRPRQRPALQIAAGPPQHAPSSIRQVVMANVPATMPTGPSYSQHEVADPPCPAITPQPPPAAASPPAAAPDPAAMAWLAASTPDEFALWQERAAIMQHDGGIPQRQAEVLALVHLYHQHMRQAGPRAGPSARPDRPAAWPPSVRTSPTTSMAHVAAGDPARAAVGP